MAPTAPETLGCYPFVTDDPFVIEVNTALSVLFSVVLRSATAELETFRTECQAIRGR